MLKKRIVAVIVVKDGIAVQSYRFSRYLPLGRPAIIAEFLDDWGADEIILLDISAQKAGREPDYAMVAEVARRSRVPLTVGGGITHLEQISKLMHCGADKVSFNFAALHDRNFLAVAAEQFGAQCVVASIDAIKTDDEYRVRDAVTQTALALSPAVFAAQLQAAGAGEILINSVDRDGTKMGFDRTLVASVCDRVSIPVICCGGAGQPEHFREVLEQTACSAAAAANFFHFFEHSVTVTKAFIGRTSAIRLETSATYAQNALDQGGRLIKKDERELEDLLYKRIEREVI